ncbi:MAG TPA: response regulator transcription factor [Firmicutes bacterium]|nr:response regulator transcription factor [Bacillota bacterium]
MEKLIAIVDDEEDIRELVAVNLKKAGYKVKEFSNGKSLLKYMEKASPELVILDVMMPEMDGMEVCRVIKNNDINKNIPVILLTAKSDETDKVLGLELGADDYVTKPFSPRELSARVKAVLRRPGKNTEEEHIKFKDIKIDIRRHRVSVKDRYVELTATEFRILRIFIDKPGRVFAREQILDILWGNEKVVVDRTIDVHIKHLREKLGSAGKTIINVRGVGYKIEE